jgi:hypothetical protein
VISHLAGLAFAAVGNASAKTENAPTQATKTLDTIAQSLIDLYMTARTLFNFNYDYYSCLTNVCSSSSSSL